MCDYIRESSNNLLFRCKVGTLLELEIADSTGESKIAVDTAEIDKATSGTYSCLFT